MTANAGANATAPAAPLRTVVRQLGIDSRYVLLNLPLAIAGFGLLVVGFAVGLGLLVTVVGLPVLVGTVYVARWFADLERLSIPAVLRRPRARPTYRRAAPGANWFSRMLTPLGQPQPWLDLAHGILRLPLAIFSFVVLLTWWSGALAGTAYVLYDWALPHPPDDENLHDLLGLPDTSGPRVVFYTALGLFFLLTLPLVGRGCALLEAGFARLMLNSLTGVHERITALEEQRAAAVSAEAIALRRLERDIHDGPQQRLVRLAMDLGRAQQQLDSDPDAARETLREALAQTRETLAELRALSRGIAPPILVDRGLPSALAALAARSTVPVDLAVDPELGNAGGRLDPAVENAAYFVVAESLTNVAKHSGASECWLTVARAGHRLGIVVVDDG
ncbi:MAG TPA: sensor domain-containing protein, partial [Micromonosporaceae bacterium]|nr:sensor domain-containing protein [Micromonosporaceae bacterium]